MLLVELVYLATTLDIAIDITTTSLEPVLIPMVVNVEALKTFYLLAFPDPATNPTTMADTTMVDTTMAV